MKRIRVQTGILILAVLIAMTPAVAMDIGMNLNSVSDWSTDHLFVDVFKKARPWCTRNADGSGAWDTKMGASIPSDVLGWPTKIPFKTKEIKGDQVVHTLVTVVEPGTYTFYFQGKGVFTLHGSGGPVQTIDASDQSGGTVPVDVTIDEEGTGTIWVEILETDKKDYLRNFKLMSPGYLPDAGSPFHPEYKRRLAPFTVLRFMDWGRTNGSEVVGWEDRTLPDTYTQASDTGAALEYMVMLANELEKDLWICIPHQVDDDYIRQCAALLRDQVDPGLNIYIEYSNETWNSAYAFTQTQWVQEKGTALNLDNDTWRAGQIYAGIRSAQVWALFESVFGTDQVHRLVHVLASQSVNADVTEQRMAGVTDSRYNPGGIMPHALAIAPYFGGHVADDIVDNNEVDSASVSEILYRAGRDITDGLAQEITAQRYVADRYGMHLIAYEGGQHLVGTLGNENNGTLTEKLIAANRSPEMAELYTDYLSLLQANGVTHLNHFSYIGEYNKWGSWGVLEHLYQPDTDSPKLPILAGWIDQDPDPGDLPDPPPETAPLLVSDFSGPSPALSLPWMGVSTLDNRIEYGGWTLGDGCTPTSGDDGLTFTLCNEAELSTIEAALAGDQYAGVTLGPVSGNVMNLSGAEISITIRRMDNHAGHRYAVFSSQTGYEPGDALFISDHCQSWSPMDVVLTFSLPEEGFDVIDGPLEFRVYPYEAQYCGKKSAVTGFSLKGTFY